MLEYKAEFFFKEIFRKNVLICEPFPSKDRARIDVDLEPSSSVHII